MVRGARCRGRAHLLDTGRRTGPARRRGFDGPEGRRRAQPRLSRAARLPHRLHVPIPGSPRRTPCATPKPDSASSRQGCLRGQGWQWRGAIDRKLQDLRSGQAAAEPEARKFAQRLWTSLAVQEAKKRTFPAGLEIPQQARDSHFPTATTAGVRLHLLCLDSHAQSDIFKCLDAPASARISLLVITVEFAEPKRRTLQSSDDGRAQLLDLLPRLAQRNAHIHLPFAAINRDLHAVAGAVIVHHLGKVVLVLNLLPVDSDDEVSAQHDGNVAEVGALATGPQARLLGGAARNHANDQQSIVDG